MGNTVLGKVKNKVLLPEIIIMVLLIAAIVILGMLFSSSKKSYRIMEEYLLSQVDSLNTNYERLRQDNLLIRKRNDSLQIALIKKKQVIYEMEENFHEIAEGYYEIIDSLRGEKDSVIYSTFIKQTGYIENTGDSCMLTPLPAIRVAVIKMIERDMYKTQVDTLININYSYSIYTTSLEELVRGKGDEIIGLTKMLDNRNQAISNLNVVTESLRNEVKRQKRLKIAGYIGAGILTGLLILK